MAKFRGCRCAPYVVGLLTSMFFLAACGENGQERSTFTLTVTLSSTGGGSVTGTGVDCGADCTQTYPQGTPVTLTATPDSNSVFTGWSGACSGSDPTCELTMDEDVSVTVTFEPSSETGGKDLSGTVDNWIGQAANIRAETWHFQETLSEAPISSDGSFSLILPGQVFGDLSVESGNFCEEFLDLPGVTSTVEVTPGPLDLAEVYELSVYTTEDSDASYLGALSYEGLLEESSFVVSQLYASSDATVTGSCTYTLEDDEGSMETFVDTFDLDLSAGWNEVVYEFADSEDDSAISTTISTGDIPGAASWQYYESESSM